MPRHHRRNFFAFLMDYTSFSLALAFIGRDSVMPSFARQITDSAPVIGLIAAVCTGGWLLPQLVCERLISNMPRKKPFMLAASSGRISLWVMALALWAGLARWPSALLTLFFICLAVFWVSDGMSSVAWFEIMSRALTMRARGRMFGLGQILGGLSGIGAGVLVGHILDHPTLSFPSDFAILFALAGLGLIPYTIGGFLIREPPAIETIHDSTVESAIDWARHLAGDSDFRRLMACRMLVAMIGLAQVHSTSYTPPTP